MTHTAQLGFIEPATTAAAAAGGPWTLAIAAGIQGAGLLISWLLGRKRGQQKLAATQVVDGLEPALKQNLEAYLDSPRTAADRAAALANFDAVWSYLVSSQGCGNPQLGRAGVACIGDRAPGGIWDWWAYYRTPIEEDTPRDNPPQGSTAAQGMPAELIAAAGIPAVSPAALLGAALVAGALIL